VNKSDLTVRLSDFITDAALRRLVEHALDEDLGRGDVTSDLLVPAGADARAVVRSRADGVIAGLEVMALVFEVADPHVKVTALVEDGSSVGRGQDLAIVSEAARRMLHGERVALNFLQRLSGVATLTAKYVEAIRNSRARIIDTRKTTPGLRALEKYAVRAGGGFNHRRDLSDAMLIKDNHLAAITARGLSLVEAVKTARASMPHTMKIEVEVDRLDQIPDALAAGADIILLDNMSTEELRQAVALIAGRAITEASGGVNLATVGEIAATGVDVISVGALTHSAPVLDIGLDFGV
jgi:nicotinate-nucleotide pyrophosphorylase (carboxylating)